LINNYLYPQRIDHEDLKLIGLEVKSNISAKISGLNAFQKTFNPNKVLLVGKGGLPWEEFLLTDSNSLF
jgi:hypothetical protein